MFGLLNLLDAPLPKAPAVPTLSVDGNLVIIGETITLGATTTDGDLARIDWVLNPGTGLGEIILATDPASAYSQSYLVDAATGNHSLVARAVRDGKKRDSLPIEFGVAQPYLESRAFLSGTTSWDAPSNFLGPSLLRDKVFAECWGGGGGGTTNTGGGGGAAYAAGEVDVTPGNSYDAVVPAGGAANTDGADATFGTTLVVAKGGLSGGNGGTGGTAAASTGTTKRDGGNGALGAGNQRGGGGAGSLAAASGGTGGDAEGGQGQNATVGRTLGAGGGSAAGSGAQGARGEVRIDYIIPALTNFARRMGYAVKRGQANTISPNMPSGIVEGELLVAKVAVRCGGLLVDITTATSGWVPIPLASDGSASVTVRDATNVIGAAAFYKIAEGGDAAPSLEVRVAGVLTLANLTLEVERYADAGVPEIAFNTGSSTNANPPNITPLAGLKNYLFNAFASIETASTTVSAVPGSYTGTKIVYPHLDAAPILISSHRSIAIDAEDPAAFTSGNEQWVAGIIAIPSSVVIASSEEEDPLVVRASSVGIYHSTDTTVIGWTALTAAARAAANASAFDAWNGDASYNSSDLRLDKVGTFEFPVDRILPAAGRSFSGIGGGSVVKAIGSAGTQLIGPGGSGVTFSNFAMDGGGTAANGSDALVDYLVRTAGTLSPNVAGSTIALVGVSGARAKVAAVYGRNASLHLKGCSFTKFQDVGLWAESCSECSAKETTIDGSSGGLFPDHGILLEGVGAGTATRNGVAMVNGCLWRMNDIVVANVDRGITYNGVGCGNLDATTVEGAQVVPYEVILSTAITATKLRSNAPSGGPCLTIEDSHNCSFQGNCTSTQHVEVDGLSRGNDVNFQIESFVGFVAVPIEFGALAWVGWRYPNGQWISAANTSPTDGHWARGQVVWRDGATAGQPHGWKCSVGGNPNGGTGVFVALPNL